MSNALSVLAAKDCNDVSGTIKLYRTDAKTARDYVKNHSPASSCYCETVSDLCDMATFMSMYEMHDIVKQYSVDTPVYPPRDRLAAAKALGKVLREHQAALPVLDVTEAVAASKVKFFPPSKFTHPCQKGSKMAILIERVARGTTIEELSAACGWAPSAVRSGLNYKLNKVCGFGYTVEMRDGVEWYQLIVPASHKGPLVA